MAVNRLLSHTMATVALSLVAIAAIIGGCTLSQPAVIRSTPCPCASNVCISPAVIQISFNQPMIQSTVENSFSISPCPSRAAPRFGWSGNRTVTITYPGPFCPDTTYTVTIGTFAKAENSIPLAKPFTFSFTTGSAIAQGRGPLGAPASHVSFGNNIRSIAIVRCSSCHQGSMSRYSTAIYCGFVVPNNPDASSYYVIGTGGCNHPGGNAWGDKGCCVKQWILAGAPQ